MDVERQLTANDLAKRNPGYRRFDRLITKMTAQAAFETLVLC